jgi:hypothetical protein
MLSMKSMPEVPSGSIRTFGELGPRYKVGRPVRSLDNGDWMVEIFLVETGEKTEYRLSHLKQDPRAD